MIRSGHFSMRTHHTAPAKRHHHSLLSTCSSAASIFRAASLFHQLNVLAEVSVEAHDAVRFRHVHRAAHGGGGHSVEQAFVPRAQREQDQAIQLSAGAPQACDILQGGAQALPEIVKRSRFGWTSRRPRSPVAGAESQGPPTPQPVSTDLCWTVT